MTVALITVLLVGFFAISAVLVYGCRRLMGDGHELAVCAQRACRARHHRLPGHRPSVSGEVLMNANGYLQLIVYLAVLLALGEAARHVHGAHLSKVKPAVLNRAGAPARAADLSPVRHRSRARDALDAVRGCDAGVQPARRAGGRMALQRLQAYLPLNPASLRVRCRRTRRSTPPASFVTNTNWQGYGGETTMSYLTQMARADRAELRVRRDRHGGARRADSRLLARQKRRHRSATSGSISPAPRCISCCRCRSCSALVLVSQGVVQTFSAYSDASPLVESVDVRAIPSSTPPASRVEGRQGQSGDGEGARRRSRAIAVGPAASQIAIKQLGTNGGGFFNVNSAHPFENPTPLSNFLEVLAILLIPAALCYTLRQRWSATRARAGQCSRP